MNNQNNPNNATNIISNNINPHQKKIDTIISNFENEIYLKNSEILEQTKDRKEFLKPSVRKRKQLQDAKFIQMIRDRNSL
jgi:ribosomal protein L22